VSPAGGTALLAGRRRSAFDRQPKYLRIHAELRDRISSGRWPAGQPLPAQRDLKLAQRQATGALRTPDSV